MMHRIPGQITDRLIAEFPSSAAGWSPCRSLKPATRPAAVGYRITGRKRIQQRRKDAFLLQVKATVTLATLSVAILAAGEWYADRQD
ncbi:MAG TPA: hypothetical protein VK659_25630, partial [Asanoa sp.]|nr:hypothetical protein [Asanoa sp.]